MNLKNCSDKHTKTYLRENKEKLKEKSSFEISTKSFGKHFFLFY